MTMQLKWGSKADRDWTEPLQRVSDATKNCICTTLRLACSHVSARVADVFRQLMKHRSADLTGSCRTRSQLRHIGATWCVRDCSSSSTLWIENESPITL